MDRHFSRSALLTLQAAVGVTAVAGGAALMLGSLDPGLAVALSPPLEHLDGSPFSSYLVPGALLAVVLGGIHLAAFVLLLRRHRWSRLAAAAAAFAALIWIFVQMTVIPFSFLQAVYFAAGLAEVGLLLVLLGVLQPATSRAPARSDASAARAADRRHGSPAELPT